MTSPFPLILPFGIVDHGTYIAIPTEAGDAEMVEVIQRMLAYEPETPTSRMAWCRITGAYRVSCSSIRMGDQPVRLPGGGLDFGPEPRFLLWITRLMVQAGYEPYAEEAGRFHKF